MRTALERGRKVQATVGLYAPNLLGYMRATTVGTWDATPKGEANPRKPIIV